MGKETMTEMTTLRGRGGACSIRNDSCSRDDRDDRDEDGRQCKGQEEEQSCYDLSSIKNSIEEMTKEQQVKILHLIRSDPGVKINSNKSGVYINLSFLPRGIMNDLQKHVRYIKEQEKQLNIDELQKQLYHESFFALDTESKESVLFSSSSM